MTLIRIDPAGLAETAALLDATAGEYEALGSALGGAGLGGMPANVGGAVGHAYADVRRTLSGLASELGDEARTLRLRSVAAAADGGLGVQLGTVSPPDAFGALGADLDSVLGLSPGIGAICCCVGGAVVGQWSPAVDDELPDDFAGYGSGFVGQQTASSAAWGGGVFTVGGDGDVSHAALDTTVAAYAGGTLFVGGTPFEFGAGGGGTSLAIGGTPMDFGGGGGSSLAIGGTPMDFGGEGGGTGLAIGGTSFDFGAGGGGGGGAFTIGGPPYDPPSGVFNTGDGFWDDPEGWLAELAPASRGTDRSGSLLLDGQLYRGFINSIGIGVDSQLASGGSYGIDYGGYRVFRPEGSFAEWRT